MCHSSSTIISCYQHVGDTIDVSLTNRGGADLVSIFVNGKHLDGKKSAKFVDDGFFAQWISSSNNIGGDLKRVSES